jgi:DNA-binding transcriptional MerR regulator
MKTGELAKILGVSDQTLLNWMSRSEISPFMSEAALAQGGSTQRLYLESDVLVLNTIRMMRAKGVDNWDEIRDFLESGQREQEFPQNAIVTDMRTIPILQAKQAADYAVLVHERDAALELAKRLESQLEAAIQREKDLVEKYDQSRTELEEKFEQSRTELEEKYQEKEQKLIEEYREREAEIREKYEKLLREIGRLEGNIEAMRSKREVSDDDE